MGTATLSEARGVFRGWQVVAAAFSVLFFAYGLQFSYGVFASGMAAELGWSRAATALPYSLYVFLYSALSAATGRATDRIGPRPVITVGAILLGLGWGASALVHEPWHLNLTLGLVAALGMSVAWVPCNATVSRWFTRRRGTAVAIASSGGSLGNLLVPALAASLIGVVGWRWTLAITAVVAAGCMLVAARFMVRDPESVGLWPDGEAEPPVVSALGPGKTLNEVCWTEPFLLLIAIYFLTWVPVFVPFVHAVAYAEDLGVSRVAAASVISAIGIGGTVGRLSSGVLSDWIGRMPALLGVFALQAAAFMLFADADGLAMLWVAATVFGFSYGGGVTLLPPLCGDLFGRAHVAAIVGMIFAVAGAPAAIGPYVAGWLFDVTGSYGAAFVSSAALNVAALALTALLAWRARRTVQ
ncbi:MAG: MFS transporter [Proteobacteria bacterium]|nr:MFS transporter [Pseudomonadota bacterium]